MGYGSDSDRAAAIACAEAGGDLALATLSTDQAAEFGMNSIANEAWVLGSEQFVRVIDATDPKAIDRFVEETWARCGGCDAVVVTDATPQAAVAAFARRMRESGGGVLVLVGEAAGDAVGVAAGDGVVVRRVAAAAGIPAAIEPS